MKRTLLFLMSLLLIVGNAWGQLTLESSTTDPSAGVPEHLYYMKNGNGNYVGAESKYQNNTPAIFAFYHIDGEKYKIYDYTSKKWLTYTPAASYSEGVKGFVTTCNAIESAEYFYIENYNSNNYQILPHKSNGEKSSVYLNYFQGTANNANDGKGLGYWKDAGSADAGSRWNFYAPEYPHNTGNINRDDRRLNSFTITDGEKSLTVSSIQTSSTSSVYVDKTSFKLTTKQGATLKFSEFSYLGVWMHAYAYIDYNRDYDFTLENNNDGTGAGEIVSYNYYDGYDIAGTQAVIDKAIGNTYGDSRAMPAFTLPKDLPAGEYRVRIKIDWNNRDANYGASDIAGNGGCQCDFTIVVEAVASQELIDKARAALGKTGLGYPKSDCQTRATLSSILEGDAPQKEELTDALNAYLTSTNIQLPENGKAYTFNIVHKDGTKLYLKYVESGMIYQSNEDAATPFVCRTLDNGKFAFVNNDGKYLVWKGDRYGYNGNKGYTDSYNADGYTDIVIKRIYRSGSFVSVSDEELFGLMVFSGKNNNQEDQYTTIGTNGDWENAPAPYYIDGYSSAIQMTEVSYPNNVTLASFEGSQLITNLEGNTIGTFSAPFPTLISDGNVVAYYAEEVKGTEYVKLRAIDATAAIPANEGVILVGTTAETTKVLMVPATVESAADISNNKFDHTAGATTTTIAGDYVLAKHNQGIGFYEANAGGTLAMNKAFLRMGTSNVAAFRLVVDEEVTAIDGVTTEKADAPIYDLSGRRVLNTIKGGIYIQNGKKFIVK